MLAFAHNSHLQRGKAQWQLGADLLIWWPAGARLDHMLGLRYAVIGTALGISDANGIGLPKAGNLEALLTACHGPERFISTHLGLGLLASEIASLPTRSGSMKNPTYFALTSQSLTDFDWLAILDSMTYSRVVHRCIMNAKPKHKTFRRSGSCQCGRTSGSRRGVERK